MPDQPPPPVPVLCRLLKPVLRYGLPDGRDMVIHHCASLALILVSYGATPSGRTQAAVVSSVWGGMGGVHAGLVPAPAPSLWSLMCSGASLCAVATAQGWANGGGAGVAVQAEPVQWAGGGHLPPAPGWLLF